MPPRSSFKTASFDDGRTHTCYRSSIDSVGRWRAMVKSCFESFKSSSSRFFGFRLTDVFFQGRTAAPAAFNATSKKVRSYAADAKASPTEVSSILEQRIRGVQEESGLAETGRVLSVGYVSMDLIPTSMTTKNLQPDYEEVIRG